jgi:cytoskeletal protein RodZ
VTEEVHKLGEVLRTAREAKGVDLARVERDTKIRERYLAALEAGDYEDLPGAVYTRGFLRNYAAYLGLEPEYLIDLYRLESSAATERPALPSGPSPLATRRSRAFVVTPGAIGAALLTIVVGGLMAWIGYQFVTFARTPELRITEPAGNLSSYSELTLTVRGVTAPNARVAVSNLAENPTVTADEEGQFEVVVRLVPGSNVMQLVATDPVTGRTSEVEERTILVTDEASSPPGSTMVLESPEDGATLAAPVPVSGSAAPGGMVEVTAESVEAAGPSFSVTTASGGPIEIPAVAPEPVSASLTTDEAGAFSGSLELTAGSWRVTVAAEGDEPIERTITVTPAAGVSATLEIDGGESYLVLDEDGVAIEELSGHNAQDGDIIELAADDTLRIRVGNAGVVRITINGIMFGLMGEDAQVVEWRVTRAGE